MRPRPAVLPTPTSSSHLSPLLSRQQLPPLTPLAATLMDCPASVANKRLTAELSPLAATLTKNRGVGAHPLRNQPLATRCSRMDSSPFFSHSCALFCAHQKLNPFIFKRFRTLCQKSRGVGGTASAISHPPLCEPSARSASLRYLFSVCHPGACRDVAGGTSHPHVCTLALAFSSPMYSICLAPGGLAQLRLRLGLEGFSSPVTSHRSLPVTSHESNDHRQQRSESRRHAASRLRKLFSSPANRRARNGFPHAEPSRVLGHGGFALRPDDNIFPFPAIRHHALDRQRRHLLRRVPPQRAQFQRHHHRSPRPGHDPPSPPVDRLGLVHQRHSRRVNFQHSAGGLRLLAFGSPLEHAFFPNAGFNRQSTRGHRERHSYSLAAPLLVFRASRSLCRDASVFRPRHASRFHVFPQAGLEGTPRGSGAVRRGPLRFLRLGTAYVFQRHESFFATGLFAAGFFPRTARHSPPDQLARHTLERARPAQHRHALRARFHFAFSLRRTLRNFPGAPRSRRRCRQRRFRHRPFPSRHGRCRNIRHSRRAVFLVPQTFWLPPERAARQNSFLADFRWRLLCFHAHALARPDRPFARFPEQRSGLHRRGRIPDSHFYYRRDSPHRFRARALPHQFSLEPLPRRKSCGMQSLARHHARMERLLAAAR